MQYVLWSVLGVLLLFVLGTWWSIRKSQKSRPPAEEVHSPPARTRESHGDEEEREVNLLKEPTPKIQVAAEWGILWVGGGALLWYLSRLGLNRIGLAGWENHLLSYIPPLILLITTIPRLVRTVAAFEVQITENRLTGDVRSKRVGPHLTSLFEDVTEKIDIESTTVTNIEIDLPLDAGGAVHLSSMIHWRNDQALVDIRMGIKDVETIRQTITRRVIESVGSLVAPLKPFTRAELESVGYYDQTTPQTGTIVTQIDPQKSVFANLQAIRHAIVQEFAMDPADIGRERNGKSQLERECGIKILGCTNNVTETVELATIRRANLDAYLEIQRKNREVSLRGERVVEIARGLGGEKPPEWASKLAQMTALGEAVKATETITTKSGGYDDKLKVKAKGGALAELIAAARVGGEAWKAHSETKQQSQPVKQQRPPRPQNQGQGQGGGQQGQH